MALTRTGIMIGIGEVKAHQVIQIVKPTVDHQHSQNLKFKP